MFTKKYDVVDAHTLDGEAIGLQPSGWTITGEVIDDYVVWLNEFEATHPVYGRVWGDFEKEVHADSEEGFNHFVAHHPPQAWDYHDI